MNYAVFILIIVLFNSCGQAKKDRMSLNEKLESIFFRDTSNMSKTDSIVVKYWKNTEANEYYFKCSSNTIEITSQYFAYRRNVSSKEIVNRFLTYINQFYINKTQPIILSKSIEPSPITDYPVINVLGFKDGKEIVAKEITLYSNIKFNPKFIEFYKFLDELITDE